MIKVNNLGRAYNDFVAVENVSFSIDRGEIVGLLGHNGAGKTTIMKMLSGYLEPSQGRIEIDHLDLAQERSAVQRRLGYLPETLPVYPEMSVADYLDYAANLKGLNGEQACNEIRRVERATGIGPKLLAPIATLSRGYRQRVGVAQAILGKPKLLILDEPTNGLDPTQTLHMRELIRELAREATVILSTHIMQEVDAVCDRVLIMRSGQLVVDARLEELRNCSALALISDIDPALASQLLKPIEGVQALRAETGDGRNRYQVTVADATALDTVSSRIARTLVENGHALYELRREQRDLETVFREVNEQAQEVRHAA